MPMPESFTLNATRTRPGPGRALRAQLHPTALGKLEGVAEQIEQHLAQAVGVAHHAGQRGGRVEAQGQAPGFCLGGEQGGAVAQQGLQVGGFGGGVQAAGPEAGGGQHVVEHGQQVLGGGVQQAQVLGLSGDQDRGSQHLSQAQDAVQRRTNFVAQYWPGIPAWPAR